MRTRSLIGFVLFFLPLSTGAAPLGCPLWLRNDAELRGALAPRLRAILESSRIQRLAIRGEERQIIFFKALDRAFREPGEWKKARFGTWKVDARVTIDGEQVRLTFKNAGLPVRGSEKLRREDFLQFLSAQMEWLARARAAGKFSGIEIFAEDLRSTRLIEELTSIGFSKAGKNGKYCALTGLIGFGAGAGIGALEGYGYFFINENSMDAISARDQKRRFETDVIKFPVVSGVVGGMIAAGTLCLDRKGYNFEWKLQNDPVKALEASEQVGHDLAE
ncbi:MAG: hypothetical protein H7301_10150 [Cryobacterium sp.]|nr:hypothetical protein [Oligoflexia bacterium]